MNILFAIDCLNIGGAQTFLLRLIKELSPHHKIVVYLLNPLARNQDLEKEYLGAQDIPVFTSILIHRRLSWIIGKTGNLLYRFGYKTFRTDLTDWIQANRIRKIIRNYDIQYVNSHLFSTDWRIYQAIKNKRIPWIVSMHGCYETFLHGGYKNYDIDKIDVSFIPRAAAIFERADGFILASDKNREINQYLPPQLAAGARQSKIYYGFAERPFTPKRKSDYHIPGRRLVFGMVARGEKYKGWEYAINAFKQIVREGLDAHLILVSNSTDYIRGLSLRTNDERILFAGESLNPLEWISLFDVALLPTYFSGESLPNSVIEYLYAGKPVIATNVGDIPQMISFGEESCGTIIPVTANRPDLPALVNALKAYILQPGLLASHQKLTAGCFKKFEMNSCVASYLNFFESAGKS